MKPVIYISEYLNKTDTGKPVVKLLRDYEQQGHYSLIEIPLNKNEWCRDYMPRLSSKGDKVLFNYKPKYVLSSKIATAKIPLQKRICHHLGIKYNDCSDIVLDGGAIEVHNAKGIISDRFINQNKNIDNVVAKIKDALSLKELIFIPPDPWDFTGHVDGLVRFIDNERVLINDYSGVEEHLQKESKYIKNKYRSWKHNFDAALLQAGCVVHQLVSSFHNNKKASSAKGIYLNFLLQDKFIIMPAFKDYEKENNIAAKQLEQLYNRKVLRVKADTLAEHGGIINCVTWCNNLK